MKMRGIRTLLTVVLSLVIMSACLSVRNVSASPAPTMYIDPHFVSADVGTVFTVDVMIEGVEPIGPQYPAVGVYGYQIHMNWSTAVLNYSTTLIWIDPPGYTVTSPQYTNGDFFADAPHGTGSEFYWFDYDNGWLEYGESMLGEAPEDRAGISGSGWLVTFEFVVVGSGSTEIDIEYGYYAEPQALTFMETYYDESFEMVVDNGYFLDVPSPWPTDIYEDGRIDIRDVARVCKKWGWEGGLGEIPEDVNDDGKVDILDLTAVGSDFGKQYYP